MASIREDTIDLDGLPFRSWQAGASTAQPVVLLHALGAGADDWLDIAIALSDRWRVIALDQRGHRGSVRPGEIEPSRVTVHGDHGRAVIDFDPGHIDARLETLPQVDLMSGPRDLHRVVFSLRGTVRSGSIRLAISVGTTA